MSDRYITLTISEPFIENEVIKERVMERIEVCLGEYEPCCCGQEHCMYCVATKDIHDRLNALIEELGMLSPRLKKTTGE